MTQIDNHSTTINLFNVFKHVLMTGILFSTLAIPAIGVAAQPSSTPESKPVRFQVSASAMSAYPDPNSILAGVTIRDRLHLETGIGTMLFGALANDYNNETDISLLARVGASFKIMEYRERIRLYLIPKAGYRYLSTNKTFMMFSPHCGDEWNEAEHSHALTTVLGIDMVSQKKGRPVGFLIQANAGIATRLWGSYTHVKRECIPDGNGDYDTHDVKTDKPRVYPDVRFAFGITF